MGFDGSWEGLHMPSSEWRFHRDILAARPEYNVVLHIHSMYATTLAIHHKEIQRVIKKIKTSGYGLGEKRGAERYQ